MKFIDNINPFYKALSIILSSILLAFTNNLKLNLTVFIICMVLLILCSNADKKKLIFIMIPVTTAAIGMYFTGTIFSNNAEYAGLLLSTRIYAFASLGLLFSLTTNSSYLVESLMQQGKMKPKFAYGIMASINLLPNIKTELSNARFALEAKGINCNIFSLKPLFAVLVNAIFWADCLVIAMESKGFCEDSDRSYYKKIEVNIGDIIFLILPQILILIGVRYL